MAQTKDRHEETEPTIAWQIGVYVGLMVLLGC